MGKKALAPVRQCRSCPWRVGADPLKDIPNYKEALHEGLKHTIREGIESLKGERRIMACHYSKEDNEFPCAGWLSNQLGPGNNVAVRLAVMTGQLPPPIVDGPQHETFEDTLPRNRRKKKPR